MPLSLPPSKKPVAFYDTECFANYWLLRVRVKGGPSYVFELTPGQRLTAAQCTLIRWLFENFCVISFNGNYYDIPMIAAALSGYDTEQLKWLSDEIILNERKPWELNLPIDWSPSDHIDLIEVAPGAGGQKTYAGRIHCKLMKDLPYHHTRVLTREEMLEVSEYCENDLSVLSDLFEALQPQLDLRERLSLRYGLDLRSKSDAQVAEKVIWHRCEKIIGRRIYKAEPDWNLSFRYEAPGFLSFQLPQLQEAMQAINNSAFRLGPSGNVEMPAALDGLSIGIGCSVYRMGIGGLHSSEECRAWHTNETHVLMDADVASYYPTLILNSGKFPRALGEAFRIIFTEIKNDRLKAKSLQKILEKQGFKGSVEWKQAQADNEGGKIMINGTFGKTGSPFSILFAPEMLIQTTLTGQLSLLMLIEWLEANGIPVVSANTDGLMLHCPRTHIELAKAIIKQWEAATGLEMEMGEYRSLYSRDVNNYFAIKDDGEVKRKGQYAKAGLVEKKNPDVEICADVVANYLSKGDDILLSLYECEDIRKFVTVRAVKGGGVKMWGEGPRKDFQVYRDIEPILKAQGWRKVSRKWTMDGVAMLKPKDAYESLFAPQTPEPVGKIIRYYHSSIAPGPIVYAESGNQVPLSYGARPCMILPDKFPDDIDYNWYFDVCQKMLTEVAAA